MSGVKEPAFPVNGAEGMALREWFAGMALQGLLASGLIMSTNEANSASPESACVIRWAYEHADAMMKARGE